MKDASKTILKKIVQQSGNILMIMIIGFLLFTRLPKWIETFRMEGSKIEQVYQVRQLDGSTLSLPLKTKRVLVFWATWCGPCTIELSRVQKLVGSQKISPSQVFAIALDGDLEAIRKTSADRGYTFMVAQDFTGDLSRLLKVEVTPTVVFLDEEDQIQWMSTGISPTLEFRLIRFLNLPHT